MHSTRSLRIFQVVSYILAGFVFVVGLITGISLMASAANINNLLLPLQMIGAEVITNLITPYLNGLINGLGIFVMIVSVVFGLLLFIAGLLLGRTASLEIRLANLEMHSE